MILKNNKILYNIYKGYRNKPSQLLLVVLLLTVSLTSFFTINNSGARIVNNFEEFADKTNLYHSSLSFGNSLSELTEEEELILIEKGQELIDPNLSSIEDIDDAMDDALTKVQFQLIFTQYIFPLRIAEIEEEMNITVEEQVSLLYYQDNYTLRVISYDSNKTINRPYIVEGTLPEYTGEIALYPEFLKANNLRVGDFVTIDNREYHIVGSIYASNYTYPMIANSPATDTENESIGYVIEQDLIEFSTVIQVDFRYYYQYNDLHFTDLDQIEANNKILLEKYNTKDGTINEYVSRSLTYLSDYQVALIYSDVQLMELAGSGISNMVLLVSLALIIFMVRRKIVVDGKYIGLFKASGYKIKEIAKSYMIIPILIILTSIIFSAILGFISSNVLYNYFSNRYAMPNLTWFYVDYHVIINGFILPSVFILLVSYVVIILLLRKKTIYLLKPESMVDTEKEKAMFKASSKKETIISLITFIPKTIIYMFTKVYNIFKNKFLYLIRKRTLPTRFRYSLVFRSPYKLFSVIFTVIISCVLISITLLSTTVASDLIKQYEETFLYKYEIRYNSTFTMSNEVACNISETNCFYKEGEGVGLRVSTRVLNFNDKEYEWNDRRLIVFGLRSQDNDLLNLRDTNGSDISHLLTEGIIITSNYARFNNVKVGDVITISRRLAVNEDGEIIEEIEDNTEEDEDVIGEITNPEDQTDTESEINPDEEDEIEYEYFNITVPVVAIADNFYYARAYYDFELLNQGLGFGTEYSDDKEESYRYNVRYTNSFDGLIDQLTYISVATDMEMVYDEIVGLTSLFDYIFIFISIICVILSLSSLTVLTIFTIEDNLNNIVVLKIMGYTDKEISSIVLNLYTPIIVVAFFLSIYVTNIMFTGFLSAMEDFMNFVLPTSVGGAKLLIGLVFVLTVYKVALSITKRSISKIPLQETTKNM